MPRRDARGCVLSETKGTMLTSSRHTHTLPAIPSDPTRLYPNESLQTGRQQVFRNCRAFNPLGDPVRKAGDKLEKHFDKLWKGAKLSTAPPPEQANATSGKNKKRKAEQPLLPQKEDKKSKQSNKEKQEDQPQAKKLKIKLKAPADTPPKETSETPHPMQTTGAGSPEPPTVEKVPEPTEAERHREKMERALAIVRKLVDLPEAELFSEPVDAEALGIPEYREVIKEPMDLGTILGRLEVGEAQGWDKCIYKGIDDVKRDIELVWNNCYTFNMPGEPISEMCKDLEKVFKSEWKKVEEGTKAKPSVEGEKESSVAAEAGPGSAPPKHIRVPGGRCPICLVQKKGRCGTETAPLRCLRRKENGLPYQEVSDAHLERLLAMQRENKASGEPRRGKGSSRTKMEREEKRRNRAYSIINTAENALQSVKDARQLLEEVEAYEEKKRLEDLEEIKEEEKLIASIPTVPDDFQPPRRELPASIYKMSSYWFGTFPKAAAAALDGKREVPTRPFEVALKGVFAKSNL